MALRHKAFTVTSGTDFQLSHHDPAFTPPIDKDTAQARLDVAVAQIGELQDKMMASSTWSLLALFQGMDTAGKDGTITHVFHGVNPAGVCVTSFKAPSSAERAQDFLWRIHQACPAAGTIGVYNRSHYEDVLVPRIHPDQLHLQHLPASLQGSAIWRHRLRDIVSFERMLISQGTVLRKFFLNVSKDEQSRRLLDRLQQPDKAWKFSPTDLSERAHWDEYQAAYTHAISATATPQAPWHIIPANHKWFARMVVAEIIADTLGQLDLRTPEPDAAMHKAMKEALLELQREAPNT